jgi:hypothetical protein
MSIESAKVVKIRRGKDFQSRGKNFEAYWVMLDNGKTIAVNTMGGEPWQVGTEATYEITEERESDNGTWYKAKKVKPEQVDLPRSYPKGSIQRPHDEPKPTGGWSKEKETSVMVQGLLKSIIESGTKSEFWAEALKKAIQTHDDAVAGILAKEQPVSAPEPTKVAQQYKPEGYKPDVHQPVGAFTQEEEGDLPF